MLTLNEAEARLGAAPLAGLTMDVKTPLWQLCYRDAEVGEVALLAAEYVLSRRRLLAGGKPDGQIHGHDGR
jgi:hypothetical protein